MSDVYVHLTGVQETTNIKKSEPINLSIFSLNGKLVKTEILHGILSELNTQNLADGLYLIRLNFENRVVYKKLVVTYYD